MQFTQNALLKTKKSTNLSKLKVSYNLLLNKEAILQGAYQIISSFLIHLGCQIIRE